MVGNLDDLFVSLGLQPMPGHDVFVDPGRNLNHSPIVHGSRSVHGRRHDPAAPVCRPSLPVAPGPEDHGRSLIEHGCPVCGLSRFRVSARRWRRRDPPFTCRTPCLGVRRMPAPLVFCRPRKKELDCPSGCGYNHPCGRRASCASERDCTEERIVPEGSPTDSNDTPERRLSARGRRPRFRSARSFFFPRTADRRRRRPAVDCLEESLIREASGQVRRQPCGESACRCSVCS